MFLSMGLDMGGKTNRILWIERLSRLLNSPDVR